MAYKYYKSDFSLLLKLQSKSINSYGEEVEVDASYPFELKFFSSNGQSKSFNVDELTTYDATYDGTSVKNCRVLDDTHVLVYFDHTQYELNPGKLYVETHIMVPDTHFEGDSVQNVKRLYTTGVVITDVADLDDDTDSDEVLASALQLVVIQANSEMEAAEAARVAAENARVAAETARAQADSERAQAIADLNAAVFPLEVAWGTSNAGTYEVGTSVTPTATATAKRKGADVSASATMTCAGATVVGLKATATAMTSGSLTLNASITQGGQTKTTGNKSWAWSYYRYKGAISAVPTDYAAAIKALGSTELTTTSTLGSTALAAGKYYLFAVKGTPTLVCRHASTDGVIGGCVKGTATIARKNGTGSDTYSYILIPASTQSWNFKITNS